jgi:hypothetical protein
MTFPVALWLLVGFVSSLLAIALYRPNGTTARKGELYMAVLGPLFGPVIAILVAIDMYRSSR